MSNLVTQCLISLIVVTCASYALNKRSDNATQPHPMKIKLSIKYDRGDQARRQDLAGSVRVARNAQSKGVSVSPTNKDKKDLLCGPENTPSGVTQGQYVIAVVTICYMPFIIVGSFLTIFATWTYHKLTRPYNYMIFSLAVADFLIGTLCIPMFAVSFLAPDLIRASKRLCLFQLFACQFVRACSLSSILLLSTERLIAVFKPRKLVKVMSKRTSKLFILLAWLGCFSASLPPLFGLNNYDPDLPCLTERCNYYNTLSTNYIWVIRGSGSFIVFLAIFLNISSYIRANQMIHLVDQITKKQRQEAERSSRSGGFEIRDFYSSQKSLSADNVGKPFLTYKQLKESLKTVRLSYFLLFVYILFTVPSVLIMPLKYLDVDAILLEYYKIVCDLLTFTLALVNPAIVTLMRREYREAFLCLATTCPLRWHRLQTQPLKDADVADLHEVMTGWSILAKARKNDAKLSLNSTKVLRMLRLSKEFPKAVVQRRYETERVSSDNSSNKATYDGSSSRSIFSDFQNI